MKIFFLLFFLTITTSVMLHAQETGQPVDSVPKTALILIDIQAFYFDTTKAALTGRYEASKKSAAILKHFRETGQEVVHIMHKGGGDIHQCPYGCYNHVTI
ncbi:hypothetical protein ACFLSP_01110 [Bacteroidota bacterium]